MILFLSLLLIVAIFFLGYRVAGSGTLTLIFLFAGEGLKRLALIGLAGAVAYLAVRFGGVLVPIIFGAISAFALSAVKYGSIALRLWRWINMGSSSLRTLRGAVRMARKAHPIRFRWDWRGRPVDGVVLQGPWRGRCLDDLTEADLDRIEAWLRAASPQTLDLLSAWRKRYRAGQGFDTNGKGRHGSQAGTAGSRLRSGQMTRAQAYAILGLSSGVDRNEIQRAYVRHMRIRHPDHGGKAEDAALINAARDLLLDGNRY